MNELGTYSCQCKAGYTGDGLTCDDRNECLLDDHSCHRHAVCYNYDGGYACVCLLGYHGDGEYCSGKYYGKMSDLVIEITTFVQVPFCFSSLETNFEMCCY